MQKKIVVGIIAVFLLITGYLAIKTASSPPDSIAKSSSPKIGVIEINGAITGNTSVSLIDSGTAGADEIMKAIRKAGDRSDIKAVVLRINSPGGTSGASQEIGLELDKLRATGKPIITSMGDVCASGGYWIACSSDHIVANGSSLTGSIGVIMELTNLQGLYEKIGISSRVIKSGDMKDMGSPSRELTSEEHQLLQAIIDDSYEQFLDQVMQGRKDKIDVDELKTIADGRIFSGRQAFELGLVDSIGNYYDALETAEQIAGMDKDSPVEILNTNNFWDHLAINMNVQDLLTNNSFVLK
ncbi:MAG TPA: signal peptide peptidase SppA [Syntrophomonadaceae bacterium]|nr:signal peptide peptidase SppA [Syntrophomonadaceae bacterium]